jgi:hypothetical protein
MSFGLAVFNAAGGMTYSSDDVTWNQVDFFRVDGGSSASKDYPVLAGREVLTAQMFVNAPPTDAKATAHTVTVSGTTVSATGGSEASYILVMMR